MEFQFNDVYGSNNLSQPTYYLICSKKKYKICEFALLHVKLTSNFTDLRRKEIHVQVNSIDGRVNFNLKYSLKYM